MAGPLPLSISVITLNEQVNLSRCLESVRDLACEIVVIDSGSTDETGALARQFGAHFELAPWVGHVMQKNRALKACTQPWVLCLDADEALSPELHDSIRRLFDEGEPAGDGYWLNRRTFYLGAWIRHAWYPEWRLRLVRREQAQWTGLDPHDRLEVGSRATARLAGDLLHYSFRDLEDHLKRSIHYGRISAGSYAAAGRRFRWHQLLLSPSAAFLKLLVLKGGWRDGWRGWLISGASAFGAFAKYAYLLERERSHVADAQGGGKSPRK